MAYGDAQALHAQEAVAPMSASPGGPGLDIPPPQDAPAAGGSGPSPVPFGAPTQRPNEPITSGVNIGAGPGQESLALEHTDTFAQQGPITQMMSQLSARDMTGSLATLFQFAQSQGV
jgi:hypothetical protein